MRPMLLLCAMLAGLAACATTGTSSTPPHLAGFGIYESGADGPVAVARTTRIPARQGTQFGVTVEFAAPVAAGTRYRWSIPEMRNPATGQVYTEMSGTVAPGTTGARDFLVRFNQRWETAPGSWTFTLEHDEREVLRQSFEVVQDYD